MQIGETSLPYSRKSLEALAATLKIHRSMVWLDPVTGNINIKQVNPLKLREQAAKQQK